MLLHFTCCYWYSHVRCWRVRQSFRMRARYQARCHCYHLRRTWYLSTRYFRQYASSQTREVCRCRCWQCDWFQLCKRVPRSWTPMAHCHGLRDVFKTRWRWLLCASWQSRFLRRCLHYLRCALHHLPSFQKIQDWRRAWRIEKWKNCFVGFPEHTLVHLHHNVHPSGLRSWRQRKLGGFDLWYLASRWMPIQKKRLSFITLDRQWTVLSVYM